MTRRIMAPVAAVCVALLLSAALASWAEALQPPVGESRFIVVLRSGTAVAPFAEQEARHGGKVEITYEKALKGFAATLSTARVAALEDDPRVQSVVADAVVHALGNEANPPWGLDRVDQRAGPLDDSYQYDTTGAGVTAFVVDTGIRATHQEFAGRVGAGYDFYDTDAEANDCTGHGTHVAGTIGGATHGVAKEVTLVPLRVLGCDGSGWLSDSIAAFDWVITHKPAGPAVVNFSVGGPTSALIDRALERVVAAGVSVVVAAGNGDTNACTGSPGRSPSAITVAATDQSDARATFSDYGSCVDLFAPGVAITSSWWASDTATATISGTSMAAPHVTGAVARYLQGHPGATPAQAFGDLEAASTQHVVASALSEKDNLLYTGSAAQLPPGPPQSSPPSVTGTVSPSTVTLDEAQPVTYTVSVTTSAPIESNLTAYAWSSDSYDVLTFQNPSQDKRHWTANSRLDSFQTRGQWAVDDFTGLWTNDAGRQEEVAFRSETPIVFSVAAPAPVTTTPAPSEPTLEPPTTTSPPLIDTSPPKTSPPLVKKSIQITYLRWDPRGKDSGTNASINGEYVQLHNTSRKPVRLTGYTLRDGQRHIYRFPKTTLGPGKYLAVHTGRGRKSTSKRFIGLRHTIWGNTRDSAQLRDRYNYIIETVKWSKGGGGAGTF